MSDTWKQWEGQIVDGKFPLLLYLGGSELCAVFLTERFESGTPVRAAIKLVPAALENGELQLSRWQQTAELSHPHLIPLYEMGRFEIGGVSLFYVVMECAEENLAQVLPDRALTSPEAREMVEAVLEVLTYLHNKGFVHGHIKPANIMASGDKLKVSSDGLRRAGELLGAPLDQSLYDPPENARGVIPVPQTISRAGDIWSLGMTLVETLTQKLPAVRTADQRDPLLPQSLQEPYLDIVRHCLLRHPQARWTVAEITARLDGRAPVPPMNPPKIDTPTPARSPNAPPSKPTVKRRSYLVPAAAGFVFVLLVILAGTKLLRHNTDTPQAPAAEAEPPVAPPAPRQVSPSPEERPTKAYTSRVPEDEQGSKAPVPVPALSHPGPIHEGAANTSARIPTSGPVQGEVVHQEMPEVLQSARDTIRGTVKVTVKVNVNWSGNVEDAQIESPGPSRYFARAALEAAQRWKFKPPMVGSRGGLSNWTLQFEFTRDQSTVVPIQEAP